jgi:hypothetical protein
MWRLWRYGAMQIIHLTYFQLRPHMLYFLLMHAFRIAKRGLRDSMKGIFFYLSASTDTFHHSVLLKRLSTWFSLTTKSHDRIEFYLVNHPFFVDVTNTKSSNFYLMEFLSCSVLGHSTSLSAIDPDLSAGRHFWKTSDFSCLSQLPPFLTASLFSKPELLSFKTVWRSLHFLLWSPAKT